MQAYTNPKLHLCITSRNQDAVVDMKYSSSKRVFLWLCQSYVNLLYNNPTQSTSSMS